MWYTIISFIYSPFFLRFLTTSDQQNDLSGNSSQVNDPRICRINRTDLLFYSHSNPELRGCYKMNERGPCGEFMLLYPMEDGSDKTLGQCDCNRKSLRTLIYHEETHRCYPIFQQGYCSLRKWLDLTREGIPVCQQNPCYKMSKNSPENNTEDLVLMNGECVNVGSNSSCLQKFEAVGFEQKMRMPTCIPTRASMRSIGPLPIKCRPGTYRAISGRCQPRFQFQFD